jgi:hypothetical protein
MYLEILKDNVVGYAKISARDMLDHLFETYGNITSVDLEINFGLFCWFTDRSND